MAIERSVGNLLNPCDNTVPDGAAAWAGGSDGPPFLEGVKAGSDPVVGNKMALINPTPPAGATPLVFGGSRVLQKAFFCHV